MPATFLTTAAVIGFHNCCCCHEFKELKGGMARESPGTGDRWYSYGTVPRDQPTPECDGTRRHSRPAAESTSRAWRMARSARVS